MDEIFCKLTKTIFQCVIPNFQGVECICFPGIRVVSLILCFLERVVAVYLPNQRMEKEEKRTCNKVEKLLFSMFWCSSAPLFSKSLMQRNHNFPLPFQRSLVIFLFLQKLENLQRIIIHIYMYFIFACCTFVSLTFRSLVVRCFVSYPSIPHITPPLHVCLSVWFSQLKA